MFTRIELSNYLSFDDIAVDLSDRRGMAKRFVVLYGENGSGKSNLTSVFTFVRKCIESLNIQDYVESTIADGKLDAEGIRRIDEFHNDFTPAKLIADTRSIGARGPMRVCLHFTIGEKRGIYELIADETKFIFESLKYQLDMRMISVYSMAENALFLHDSVFPDKKYGAELRHLISKYYGRHTIMAIMYREYMNNNPTFMEKSVNPIFAELVAEFVTTDVSNKTQIDFDDTGFFGSAPDLMTQLDRGTIDQSEIPNLDRFECALNDFFMPLYTDIKSVFYKKTETHDGRVEYELYFRKRMHGIDVEIPLTKESTGTQRLMQFFPFLHEAVRGCNVIIDEFDTGIHDLLIGTILQNVQEKIKGQLIITTHNTSLLETLKDHPESIYVIDIDAEGYKRIVSIDKTGYRLQKNHNPRDRYLRGSFGGAPFVGYFDMGDIVAETAPIYGQEE